MVQLNPEGNPQKWLGTILSRAKFEEKKNGFGNKENNDRIVLLWNGT